MSWLLLLAAASQVSLHGAIIHGQVVEKQSGIPIARALVVAHPVAGSKGATRSVRSSPNGLFEIADLPPGMYTVTASKTGFVDVEYGQRRWFSAGAPVEITESTDLPVRLALPHFGAITGRVMDENNVGIVKCTVLVYRNTRPPVLVGKAQTDDRGVYRISGLMPGSYLTRTDTFESDVNTFLATFGRETTSVESAVPVDAALDQDTIGADIRPIGGRLFSIAGRVLKPSVRGPAQVTLVSDMGSLVSRSDDGRFSFEHLAPGAYELLARAPDRAGILDGYLAFDVERDMGGIQVETGLLPPVRFSFRDIKGNVIDPTGLPLLVRRKELSGPGTATYLAFDADNQAKLQAGRWELSLAPNAAWYVADFAISGAHRASGTVAGWNEMLVDPRAGVTTVQITLSPETATLDGIVLSGDTPVAGAPVHLEAFQPQTGRRIRDLRTARTDTSGHYSFAGLPPGDYRVLATFEYQAPETAQMTIAGATEIRIESAQAATRNLKLWEP